jgi:hypothetical protein
MVLASLGRGTSCRAGAIATDGHWVGWQNRDWAKHDDDELAKLYGVVPHSTRTVRIRIWSTVTVLTFAVGGFAYTQLPTTEPFVAAGQTDLLFGLRGTNQRVPSDYPGGTGTACNEEEYTAETGQWSCMSWAVNVRNLPIVQPPAYVGPCTHLLADQEHARWICLGGAPLPQQPPPPPVAGLYA